MTNKYFDSTQIWHLWLTMAYLKKKNRIGTFDDCNTFFFYEISITALLFYWRNDTPTFVTWQSSSPNQFVTEIVSPLPCLSGLVQYILLFVYFFKEPFLSLAPLKNVTPAFSMLRFVYSSKSFDLCVAKVKNNTLRHLSSNRTNMVEEILVSGINMCQIIVNYYL